MLGRDHQITTAAVALTIASWTPGLDFEPVSMACFVVPATITALAPDLDSENSIASQKTSKFFSVIFKHRGFLHSIFGWLLWTFLCYKIVGWLTGGFGFDNWYESWSWMFYLGLSFGYLAHLIEDSFSAAGVRWLNPFTPCDEKMYEKYGVLLRPVHHYEEDEDGHTIPCRHFWGRGYETGGDGEYGIIGFMILLIIIDVIRLVVIW